MSGSLIFVGGVHGAGKTAACATAAARTNFHHVTASELIRASGVPVDSRRVTSVEENQRWMLQQLENLRKSKPSILLDGHFCLLTQSHTVETISHETFRLIAPSSIFIIVVPPNVATLRTPARYQNVSSEIAAELAAQEIEHGRKVANELGVSLRLIDGQNDEADVADAVASAVRQEVSR